MSVINTNISSLIAVNALNTNNQSLQTSLERLSTGYRINSGKDDPSGLIASENLQAEQTATSAAISNAQQANNIIGTAEGALSEVSNLLVSLQGLVNDSANTSALSEDEKNANQLQVDSILSTINRISNSASFQGVSLLNGTFDYTTSGAAASAITSLSVNAAQVPTGGSVSVVLNVTSAAKTGELNYLGSSTGLQNATTLTLAGANGSQAVSFAAGTHSSAIVASINQFTDSTGVKATLSTDSKSVKILSNDYGSSQFVSVSATDAAFANHVENTTGTVATSSHGQDVQVTINGNKASSNGLNVEAVSGSLDVSLTLNSAANTASISKTFDITGGGATFSLGATVNAASYASIGIATVDTAHIGKELDSAGNTVTLADLGSGKEAALNTGNASLAQSIVTKAINDVASLRGRLGAFQSNVLSSTINSLNVALENVSSSESAIQDTDFASETANLTKSQILVQAATSVLAQANAAPQNVLKLLG